MYFYSYAALVLKSVSLSETHEKCSRSWYSDSQHERSHFRCPPHKVLDCRQEAYLHWKCQHGLEVSHTGTHTHTQFYWCFVFQFVVVKTDRINESSLWFVGKRAGDSYLQLQLPGCRPGEDLWSLLVPGWQSVSPVTMAGQIHHPLQQGHAPPAATQQHAIKGLSVCKIFIILWYQP